MGTGASLLATLSECQLLCMRETSSQKSPTTPDVCTIPWALLSPCRAGWWVIEGVGRNPSMVKIKIGI